MKNSNSSDEKLEAAVHTFAFVSRATNDIGAAVNRYFPELDARANTAKKKQIYKWERQRATIEERASSVVTTHGRHQRGTGIATTLPRDAERELSEWISDLRNEGIPVSAKMLELRALEMARELNIPVGGFVASWHSRQADKIEEDFYAHLQSVVRDKGIVKVLNADHTGVVFEYLYKRVISEAGKRTVWEMRGGADKERVTMMLLGDADGLAYPAFLVFKCGCDRSLSQEGCFKGSRVGALTEVGDPE
ncbi:hypothetical protein PybrP1_001624 [[Pythium] brassicae (nom. inval.)]|nr:hypothetical protein PybrP1_001624 [[Pythium] brassicae (nom. inval.)]